MNCMLAGPRAGLGLLLCILGLPLALAGCESSPDGLAVVGMKIGNAHFTLEVANTDASMERGLMKRDAMGDDHGMIFVFPDEQEREFWMKNTRFPLDIIFLSAAGKVVSIKHMAAYDESRTSSDLPAQYAIELNLGRAAAAAVAVGDQIDLPKSALNPATPKPR